MKTILNFLPRIASRADIKREILRERERLEIKKQFADTQEAKAEIRKRYEMLRRMEKLMHIDSGYETGAAMEYCIAERR